ncbi:hypothetical protein LOOC260_107640 [Paucilactobacillus hokkaidonensis JCM 18461]|uniref:Antitoxin n=2 Tax=Paucilactobacillus hokkaidonensis TaxID=1193095 RepID=A0A0A1GW82_9LACO|nr:hypothetical protein [Paucilactobacillus hokkaidonensis]KRO09286.1 hypothetical protein IV59_GL000739 [Paucilactobacillus hokkaidonensis]BAP85304.1 hypothetical protein LOOC260_107640 [Paucilactobacillus hokkaidonensis JCM 18461]
MDTMDTLDIYTPTNFRKNQANIFKSILSQNKPVEITIASEHLGPNDGIVAISKKDYEEYLNLKQMAVDNAKQEIAEYSRARGPRHLSNPKEIEAWFDEGE